MNNHQPTYEELQKRLAESEALVNALRKHEIDTIIGEDSVAVVRLREVEEQLVEARRTAEGRANDLEAFSYSVSHDLRNPLNSIKVFSAVLLEDYSNVLDDTGREYFHHIVNNIDKMTSLINDILNLSMVSQQELLKEKVDLRDLSEKIISEIQSYDPDRGVEVIIAEKLVVNADLKLLKIALTNLLKNSWKFTSKTSHACIEIGVTEQKGTTVFFVRDNGAGFDMANVDKIFEPFRRLHSESQFPGTGIGLAIVKKVIRKHGGKIWANSEPGKGATFYFTIPS